MPSSRKERQTAQANPLSDFDIMSINAVSVLCHECLQVEGDGMDDASQLAARASLPSNHNLRTLPPLKKNARGAWQGM